MGEILCLTLHPHFKAHGFKTSRKGALRKAMGEYQSGQMGQTVNLLVYTFGGSNPSSPTNELRDLRCKASEEESFFFEPPQKFTQKIAGIAQLIEHQPSKLRVAGLSPVSRSNVPRDGCCYSSVVEHFLGKEEVTSSNLVNSSKF